MSMPKYYPVNDPKAKHCEKRTPDVTYGAVGGKPECKLSECHKKMQPMFWIESRHVENVDRHRTWERHLYVCDQCGRTEGDGKSKKRTAVSYEKGLFNSGYEDGLKQKFEEDK